MFINKFDIFEANLYISTLISEMAETPEKEHELENVVKKYLSDSF